MKIEEKGMRPNEIKREECMHGSTNEEYVCFKNELNVHLMASKSAFKNNIHKPPAFFSRR
jgi:hypothetical protein